PRADACTGCSGDRKTGVVRLLLMDVRRLRGKDVGIGDVLVLGVRGNVAKTVRGRRGVEVARISVGNQAVGSDHHRVRTPLVRVGDAPVRVVAFECGDAAIGVDVLAGTQGRERAIRGSRERQLAVQRLLTVNITVERGDLALQAAGD